MSELQSLSQRGRFSGPQPISELMRLALARPELVSLAAGFVDQESLPVAAVEQALQYVLSDGPRAKSALQYGTNAGYLPLREAVLARFLAADGRQAGRIPSTDQVLLTAGSNQLLHLVGEVLFDPGDVVLCSAPTYFVYLGLLSSLGVRASGIAIDAEGMIPESLEAELQRRQRDGELNRVKAIYVTSYFENPSTVTLSLARRAQLVDIAKRWSFKSRIFVIDDAAYRELRFAGDDLPSLRSFDCEGDTVIVAETFSKSFSPGIRVGWGILPKDLVAPVAAVKANIDFGSAHLNQQLMAAVLELELLEPHIERLRAAYLAKLTAMLTAMDEHLAGIPSLRWRRPRGGLYVWLELPSGLDAGPNGVLINHALSEGVIYVPGEYCFPGEGEALVPNAIRLSFGVQTAENIRRGIQALARAIKASL
jgi:2-aminoadipate transaminase